MNICDWSRPLCRSVSQLPPSWPLLAGRTAFELWLLDNRGSFWLLPRASGLLHPYCMPAEWRRVYSELQLRPWFRSFFPVLLTAGADHWQISVGARSHLQVIPVSWDNKELILLCNKKTRSSAAPGLITLEAQQPQQIPDYFHLFSDWLSLSSQLLS